VEELIWSLEVPSVQGSVQVKNIQWHRPLVDVLKINSNGASDMSSGVARAGFGFRDHTRAFVAAPCRLQKVYTSISDPFTTELIVIASTDVM
jgi:hypothetical protein